VRYRDSVAVGAPSAGRLVRGVRLPAAGRHFETWDPILRRSPNRGWRRNGTDDLVRLLLRVARRYAAAEPDAPPMLIGDLSRPRGGDFGVRYGIVGHSTHQNGLDADVYYPRLDRRRRVPGAPAQVDQRLSQRLVDLFVAAGAQTILVGPNLSLTGPRAVVKPFPNHDNHLHVRIANPG
jgi:murein endopeptidase